ncbi:MAG: hypothetical protein WCJ56_15880 [bacterium]
MLKISVKQTLLRISVMSSLVAASSCLFAQGSATIATTIKVPTGTVQSAIAAGIAVEPYAELPTQLAFGDEMHRRMMVIGDKSNMVNGQLASWNYQELSYMSGINENPTNYSNQIVFSMGYALPAGSNMIGDMMRFNDKTYIRINDPVNGVTLRTEKDAARTPYAIMVPPQTMAEYRLYRSGDHTAPVNLMSYNNFFSYYNTQPISVTEAMRKIADAANGPVLVLGWIESPQLNGYALKAVPANGVNPFGADTSTYQDKVRATNAYALIMAYVQPPNQKGEIDYQSKLSKYFGANSTTLNDYHQEIHVALINERPQPNYTTRELYLEGLKNLTVKDIFHIDDKDTSSLISRGKFMVFSPTN